MTNAEISKYHKNTVSKIIELATILSNAYPKYISKLFKDRVLKEGDNPLPFLIEAVRKLADDKDVTVIRAKDVIWTMDWSGVDKDGNRRHPNKPLTEEQFETDPALAILLAREVVFTNSFWWEKDWPEDARNKTSISVSCNDVFAWGCADAEGMDHSDIESVYRHWLKDPSWGTAIWCIIKRGELPQRPVAKRIADQGIWDLEALQKEHGLKNNHYDGISHVTAKMKYDTYTQWKISLGEDPLPFDAGWWEGWRDYTKANPDWYNEEYKTKEKEEMNVWRVANGFEPRVG